LDEWKIHKRLWTVNVCKIMYSVYAIWPTTINLLQGQLSQYYLNSSGFNFRAFMEFNGEKIILDTF
jgi:hypothetical protein